MKYPWICLSMAVSAVTLAHGQSGTFWPKDSLADIDPRVVGLWSGPIGRVRFDGNHRFRATSTAHGFPSSGDWTTVLITTWHYARPTEPFLCLTWQSKREPIGVAVLCHGYVAEDDGTSLRWGEEVLRRVEP
jgi:hypothetical protein